MSKRNRAGKFTTSHKITVGALGVLGIVGGWNVIARTEAYGPAADSVVENAVTPVPTVVWSTPTPWPKIDELTDIPRVQPRPLPTRPAVVLSEPDEAVDLIGSPSLPASVEVSTAFNVNPLPTLAPLPTLPEYVAPPPPPPPPAQVASNPNPPANGGASTSQGS